MSDTPRTDENTMTFEQSFKSLFIDFVDAGFAQQLERELAAAKAVLRKHEFCATSTEGEPECPECQQYCQRHTKDCAWATAMGEEA